MRYCDYAHRNTVHIRQRGNYRLTPRVVIVKNRLERLRNVVEKVSQVSDDEMMETGGELSMPALTRGGRFP